MSRIAVAAVATCILCAATRPGLGGEHGEPIPEIVVDTAHCHMYVPEGQVVPNYAIAASASIVVDASEYVFEVPPPLREKMCGPSSIQIASDNGTYSGVWPEHEGRMVLDATTLEPLRDSAPFKRFIENTTYLIGIGYSEREGDLLRFYPFWIGMVDIRGGDVGQ